MEINYSSPPTAERSFLTIILLLANYLYLLGSSNTHHLYGRGPKAGLTRPSDRHCNWELFARRLTDRRRMMRRWSVCKGERGHCHPQILNYDPTSRANESSNWMLFGKTLLLLPLPNDVEIDLDYQATEVVDVVGNLNSWARVIEKLQFPCVIYRFPCIKMREEFYQIISFSRATTPNRHNKSPHL